MNPQGGVEDRIVRALEQSRDFGIRIKVEDFNGHLDPSELLDWLDNIKHFFEWKELPDERKVEFDTLS